MASDVRIRVEELARRSECSVDTIRFYQKRRLLPAPDREGRIAWYGTDHVDRLARIRALQAQGLPLAVIDRILRGDLDAADAPLAAAVARALAAGESRDDGPERFDRDELARRVGVDGELIEAVTDAGLLGPRPDAQYTAADVEMLRAGMGLLEQGLPLPALLDLARSHHAATRAIAEEAVQLFDEYIRRPLRDAKLSDEARADRLLESFASLLPAVSTLVEHHFRQVLLEVAQEHLARVGEAELAETPDRGRPA